MGKLKVAMLRYLVRDDFRILTAVSKNCPFVKGNSQYVHIFPFIFYVHTSTTHSLSRPSQKLSQMDNLFTVAVIACVVFEMSRINPVESVKANGWWYFFQMRQSGFHRHYFYSRFHQGNHSIRSTVKTQLSSSKTLLNWMLNICM